MLLNKDLGNVFPVSVLLYLVLAVDEEHDIGILLNGAGFAEVGKLGDGVGTHLHGAGKLGNGEHGHVQLFGHGFQRARYLGYLLHPVFGVLMAADELEVVHHDQAKIAVLGLEPPRHGPDLHHRRGGDVINVQRDLGKRFHGVADADEIVIIALVRELAGAEAPEVNAGLIGDQAVHDLL